MVQAEHGHLWAWSGEMGVQRSFCVQEFFSYARMSCLFFILMSGALVLAVNNKHNLKTINWYTAWLGHGTVVNVNFVKMKRVMAKSISHTVLSKITIIYFINFSPIPHHSASNTSASTRHLFSSSSCQWQVPLYSFLLSLDSLFFPPFIYLKISGCALKPDCLWLLLISPCPVLKPLSLSCTHFLIIFLFISPIHLPSFSPTLYLSLVDRRR